MKYLLFLLLLFVFVACDSNNNDNPGEEEYFNPVEGVWAYYEEDGINVWNGTYEFTQDFKNVTFIYKNDVFWVNAESSYTITKDSIFFNDDRLVSKGPYKIVNDTLFIQYYPAMPRVR